MAITATAAAWSQIPGGMVEVPRGSYQPLFGGDTAKRVYVEAFLMDRYLVTHEEYLAFVREHPDWKRSAVKPIFADAAYLKAWTSDTTFSDAIKRSPVTNVSWFAARKYCACQGKRLATADEWEYAASASLNNPDGSGDSTFRALLLEWYSKPNPGRLPSVGSTVKNYYGIWDMHRLVWEWVHDFNSALITGDSRADKAASSGLFCGSGALAANDFNNYVAFLRYGFRGSLKANYCINNLGFRCAK